jgi:hypothetical protein
MNETKIQVLASYLHDNNCRYNHIDGCSWDYGSWDEPTHAHELFYKKAERLLEFIEELESGL